MKKVVVIFLMLAYGLSATGATLHLHFCCGKLDEISFSSPSKKACPTKTVSREGCCDNKHVELKLKADQEPAAKWIGTIKNFTTTHNAVPAQPFSTLYWTQVNRFATGPPRTLFSVPLFLKNQVFRI